MAGSVNKVILVGNLGADPEIRSTRDGRPVATLSIATSDSWRDRASGERRERTEWHRVVIFSEGLCKIVERYLKKGAKVYLEGELRTRKWQDQSNADRYTTEVVLQNFNGKLTMLDSRQDGESGRIGRERGAGTAGAGNASADNAAAGAGGANKSFGGKPADKTPSLGEELDDEVPF